jgi:hypothetical protein
MGRTKVFKKKRGTVPERVEKAKENFKRVFKGKFPLDPQI